ncbi:MAG: hypothetical protein AAB861_03955 [Patescibacteria group bacterium]
MEGLAAKTGDVDPAKRAEYEALLWQRAEEFAVVRGALQQRIDELEKIFAERPTSTLNLHEEVARREEEKEYWETKAEVKKIREQEDAIQKCLEDLDKNIVNSSELQTLLPTQTAEEKVVSKRKQRILEEKKRFGLDPRSIMDNMYAEFGMEKMHLTTGRHATGVKNLGSVDPLTAAAEFYYRTTDTHGGKVAYGKRSASYVNSSGKRIRKK